jgi:mRNA interferase RelE/StbE
MKVEIKKSFLRDLKKLHKNEQSKALNLIDICENATSINEIENIKKISGFTNFYRIRLGNYRVGLMIENEIITFVRYLHRKDIYKFFP